MNLNEITKLLKEATLVDLDTEKYNIKMEEYSWCVDVIVCNKDYAHLQSFLIRRFNEAGDFGIGVQNHEHIDYLAKGNLSGDLNTVINEFVKKFNLHQDYHISRKKEQISEYQDIKFTGVKYE